MSQYIEIKNARVHNLKNIDLKLPRNELIVITGLSGSGKSSLAFDTLYAEGQRRYVESLSSYVRQFLGRMDKPEVDLIKGIPPAIAIEQKVISNNPRSTVGTTTEIYEYLKLLFARIGRTYSPISGNEVKRHTVEDVINHILSLPADTPVYLLTPLSNLTERKPSEYLNVLLTQGFSRVEHKGEFVRISEIVNDVDLEKKWKDLNLVIDRLRVSDDKGLRNRLYDSIETAFFEGKDVCIVAHEEKGKLKDNLFSKAFEADGMTFELPSEKMFAFNSPLGACPRCEGYGRILGIDPDLVIPDKSLSVYQDAVVCWRGEVMTEWKQELIANAEKFKFPVHRPYYMLTTEQKKLLWTGNKWFHGLDEFFKWVETQQYKIQYRVMLARYRGRTVCPECGGTRLRKEASYVKIAGKSISDLVDVPVSELTVIFDSLRQLLTANELEIAKRLLVEITNRIRFLIDVGLGYLTLNRLSNSLSGGESQRINLATSLGSSLVGSLYILDEPSIGLHPRDTELLISVLRKLRNLGNTVIVVEHDEEIMRAADHIVDIGPEAGIHGGKIVMDTAVADLQKAKAPDSYTLKYLNGELCIPIPHQRRKWSNFIEIKGAFQNNLKNIDVRFPLGVMTVVTGVSGSGKSSLVRDVLYQALQKRFTGSSEKSDYGLLEGSLHLISSVEMIDQNPIGKSSRSNPVTYLKAFDDIRKLFAEQQMSKQMGFTAAHFSFNVDGGRCEVCNGDGTVTVPMQFMADLILPCEACHGTRYKQDVLEIKYRDKNIHDVLEMSVNQAITFFSESNDSTCRRIVRRLKPLQDVGIGYVKLGQSSSTLSGGESQRVKLAYFLAQETNEPMFFIFDEPTTGLHTHDINTLLKAFDALLEKGHSILIVEHNMHVIKSADYMIDIGPEGGVEGGYIVAEGTPEKVATVEASYTGKYLKEILNL